MYALDFEYDGRCLSDYGFIICDFDGSSGANIVSAGSTITFNTVSHNQGKIHSLTSTQFDERIQATFDICKDPDQFDDTSISDDEYRLLTRWLNRREFLRFRVINEDPRFTTRYYNGSFNISKIKIREILYGLRLTLETDKPFAYGVEQAFYWDITNIYEQNVINDLSDDVGSVYAKVKVVCLEDGDLTLTNSFENRKTIIRNCTSGEVITLDGNTHIITTTDSTHDICNDFNYNFFRIGNTSDSRKNTITTSLKCTLEIKYFPIIKDTP